MSSVYCGAIPANIFKRLIFVTVMQCIIGDKRGLSKLYFKVICMKTYFKVICMKTYVYLLRHLALYDTSRHVIGPHIDQIYVPGN